MPLGSVTVRSCFIDTPFQSHARKNKNINRYAQLDGLVPSRRLRLHENSDYPETADLQLGRSLDEAQDLHMPEALERKMAVVSPGWVNRLQASS
jgi:hypothetical protein